MDEGLQTNSKDGLLKSTHLRLCKGQTVNWVLEASESFWCFSVSRQMLEKVWQSNAPPLSLLQPACHKAARMRSYLPWIRSPRLQVHDLPLVWFPRVLHVLQSANHSSKKRKARQLERACTTKLYRHFTPQSFSALLDVLRAKKVHPLLCQSNWSIWDRGGNRTWPKP